MTVLGNNRKPTIFDTLGLHIKFLERDVKLEFSKICFSRKIYIMFKGLYKKCRVVGPDGKEGWGGKKRKTVSPICTDISCFKGT